MVYECTGGQCVERHNEWGQDYYLHIFSARSGGDLTPLSDGLFHSSTSDVGAHLQDSWKPAAGLTVNLGLRWDSEYLRDYRGVTVLHPQSEWQPRVGVVWDPWKNGQTKVYASAGRFYYGFPNSATTWAFGNVTGVNTCNFDPLDTTPNPNVPGCPFDQGQHDLFRRRSLRQRRRIRASRGRIRMSSRWESSGCSIRRSPSVSREPTGGSGARWRIAATSRAAAFSSTPAPTASTRGAMLPSVTASTTLSAARRARRPSSAEDLPRYRASGPQVDRDLALAPGELRLFLAPGQLRRRGQRSPALQPSRPQHRFRLSRSLAQRLRPPLPRSTQPISVRRLLGDASGSGPGPSGFR